MALSPEGSTPQFAKASVVRVDEPGGGFVLRSPIELGPYARCIGEWIERWAREAPDRTFLVERDEARQARRVTYAELFAHVRSLAQGLIDLGVSRERPLLVLSDNSIDHAELALAAMMMGAPVAPVSPAYSLLTKDFAKLTEIARCVSPGVVFADDGERFKAALENLGTTLGPFRTVVSKNPTPSGLLVDDLRARDATSAVDAAFAAVDGDTIAKILFTSGSTGAPKGVVNTHRMLCSNQAAMAKVWPFLQSSPPIVVDWLPWSHTFGANHNFNMVLSNGGTLAIDAGKPTPERIGITAENIRDVSPTLYFNVPRGFDVLLPLLEQDSDLRNAFFRRLKLVFYAAASLPQPLWERLEAVSILARGTPITMVSAWGSTETSPLMTSVHFPIPRAGVIGLPIPGSALRFVPNRTKLEMRVAGPNVTLGYWDRGTVHPAPLDEAGFLPTGDAGRLEDPGAPEKGVVFDGRIAENFKLSSGTWVSVSELRVRVVGALAPLVQDAVVLGHDRESIALLLFANEAACRALVSSANGLSVNDLYSSPEVREAIALRLRDHNLANAGSSTRVWRAILSTEPPSIDAGEITDKGYINQRAVLDRRADSIDAIYATNPDDSVISIT